MDKSQADAVAEALLAPAVEEQEALRRKRAREEAWQLEKRMVAWLGLIGFAMGAVVAYFAGERPVRGALLRGIAGAAVGWLWIGWRKHRGAA